MKNLEIYEQVRTVPAEAQKLITGGRLAGKTDINPMWRIRTLTEQFGPCGIGWRYVIRDKRLEPGANGEIAAFVDIDLYIKVDGSWSEAIPGTGGALYVTKEKNGLYTNDECIKMALTDALSVAAKALGIAADVYWSSGSKYTSQAASPEPKAEPTHADEVVTPEDLKPIYDLIPVGKNGKPDPQVAGKFRRAYSEMGYQTAKEIRRIDFEKIKQEFLKSGVSASK